MNKKLNNFTIILIAITFVQLMYGAFMAGLKAAIVAPTWPTINGGYFPNTLTTNNLIHDADLAALQLNIQFMHRSIAYLLLIAIVVWFIIAYKHTKTLKNNTLNTTKWYPLLLVLMQVMLGIFAVLCSPMIRQGKFGVFETIAELHQLVAMFLLMAIVVNWYVVRRKPFKG